MVVARRDRLQGDNSLQQMTFATEGNGAWNLSHKKQFIASLMESCGASAQAPPTYGKYVHNRDGAVLCRRKFGNVP